MLDWYRRRVIARRDFTVNILLVYLKGTRQLFRRSGCVVP